MTNAKGNKSEKQQAVQNKSFTFDLCFDDNTTQEAMFAQSGVKELIDLAFNGYSTTVFAYGQTGSGKTFTIAGDEGGTELFGIVPRATSYIFETVQQMRQEGNNVSIRASYLEIWNEQINDLLNLQSVNLPIRLSNRGFFVENLFVVECSEYGDLMSVVHEGISNRKVSSHELNKDSSRSHSIFTVHFEIENIDAQDGYTSKKLGKIHFVDLAGSERLKESKAKGTAALETAHINKSLLTLGKVIRVLSDPKREKGTYVPYRDSKLTQLLMDSIGGGSKTLMIACVTPSNYNSEETLNTLLYANRAKKIKNKPFAQIDPKEEYIQNLKAEINNLREQVVSLKTSTPDNDERIQTGQVRKTPSKKKKQTSARYKLSSGVSSMFEVLDENGEPMPETETKLKTLEQVVEGVNVDRSASSLSGIGGAIGSGNYYPPLDPQFAAIVAQKERLEAEMKDLKALLAQSNSQNIPNKKYVPDEEEIERIRRENVDTTRALTSLKQMLEQKDEKSKKEKQLRRQYDKQLQEYERKAQQAVDQNQVLEQKCQELESMLHQGMYQMTAQQQGIIQLNQQQQLGEEEINRLRREHRWLLNENQYLKRLFKERGLSFEQESFDQPPATQRSSYDQAFRTNSREAPSVASVMKSRSIYSSSSSTSSSVRNYNIQDSIESILSHRAQTVEPAIVEPTVTASIESIVEENPKTPTKELTVDVSTDSIFNTNPIITPQSARHAPKQEPSRPTIQHHARQPKEKPRRQDNIELPEYNALNNNQVQPNSLIVTALTKPVPAAVDMQVSIPKRRGDKGYNETTLPAPQESPDLNLRNNTRQETISPAPTKPNKPKRKSRLSNHDESEPVREEPVEEVQEKPIENIVEETEKPDIVEQVKEDVEQPPVAEPIIEKPIENNEEPENNVEEKPDEQVSETQENNIEETTEKPEVVEQVKEEKPEIEQPPAAEEQPVESDKLKQEGTEPGAIPNT